VSVEEDKCKEPLELILAQLKMKYLRNVTMKFIEPTNELKPATCKLKIITSTDEEL